MSFISLGYIKTGSDEVGVRSSEKDITYCRTSEKLDGIQKESICFNRFTMIMRHWFLLIITDFYYNFIRHKKWKTPVIHNRFTYGVYCQFLFGFMFKHFTPKWREIGKWIVWVYLYLRENNVIILDNVEEFLCSLFVYK